MPPFLNNNGAFQPCIHHQDKDQGNTLPRGMTGGMTNGISGDIHAALYE
jgi:hypothetical protein